MGRGANFQRFRWEEVQKELKGIEEIKVHEEVEISIVCPLPGIDEFQSSISLLSGILV